MKIKTIERYFFYFMLYSVIGWLYEVFLEVVVYRWGFSNRGTLFGPYCIVYGVGALALLFALRGLQQKEIFIGKFKVTWILVFFGIVVITTVIELVASYIMEWAAGEWMWDYTRFAFNFQGRIAPNPSLRFGLGGMLFLYVLQPLFERLADSIPPKVFSAVVGALAVVFLLDVAVYLLK